MKRNRNNSARASALQVTVAFALIAISAILLASSFKAAPSTTTDVQQQQSGVEEFTQAPAPVEDAPAVLGTCDTAGPIEVEATAGVLGPIAYPTLQAALAAINAGTHQGVINIEVCGNTTETATASLDASGGASSYTSVTVRPVGAARIIEGTIAGAIIKLNGADNVTIDGRIGGTGSSRDLTVRNNSTAAATAAIWLASVAAGNGASNNVIRNLEIANGATSNTGTNSNFGIIMCGTTISVTANGVDNDNNQFIFNRVIRARYGIVTRGTAATDLNINPVVTDNIVGPAAFGADEIGKCGILMQADSGAIVSRNVVQFVGGALANTTAGADRVGIGIGLEDWGSAPVATTSTNYTVTKNVIHDVIDERTFSAVGIILANANGATGTNSLVANNMIYNVRADGTSGDTGVGIGIAGGGNDQVVFNSISMTGDLDPGVAAVATQTTAGIRVAVANSTAHFGLLLRDNSIYMDVNSNTGTVLACAIQVNSATYAFLGGSGGLNYNNYYFPPGNPQMRTGAIGAASLATTFFTTLANWQAALTPAQDFNSIQADPVYVSNTADLHITGSANIDAGITVAGVADDIDAQARPNCVAPDIGADEVIQGVCGTTPTPAPSPTPTPTATPSPSPTATGTPVGCSTGTVTEDFDSVVAPALPSGWSPSNAVGAAPLWVTSTAGTPAPATDTAPNAAFIDDPAALSDKRLDSVPYTIANAGVVLTFRNNFDLEDNTTTAGIGFDGGVLEIKVGAGAYTDIITAGGTFITGGYTDTISTGFSSPIAGRQAWSGSSAGFITTSVVLPPSATGQSVIFRWRMCSDASISKNGWRIDTIALTCGGGPTPTVAPTQTPTASPVPTVSPTPSPSGTPSPTATPAPTGSPTPTPACASPTTLLSQDFESGLGAWTAVNNSTGGTNPALVIWAVHPNPFALTGFGSSASTETLNSGQGTQFALADSDAAGSGVTADTTLTSPSFSTVGFTSASLSYKLYYRHLTTSAAFTDVSTDGGTIWTTVKTYGATIGAQAAFVYDTIDLTPFAGNANVKIRFRHTATWLWYYAVDDIIVSGCGTAGTPSPTPSFVISGKVANCSSPAPTATPPAAPTPPILPGTPNVLMTLSGSASGTTLTDASGNYSFTVAGGGTYTVTPSKASIPPAGANINNLDVLAIQRHFLLIAAIPAGCRLTAADANLSASVNSQDVLAVQRFFLGFTSGIGSVGQYKFVPASRSYAAIAANQTAQNYEVYVVGDAAASFNNRPGTNENDMGFSSVAFVALPDVALIQSMSNFTAPVTSSAVDANERIVGFQGDFTFDERVVKFASEPVEKAGLTAGNWTVAGNVLPGTGPIRTLRVLAYSNDFAPMKGAGTLFQLKMDRVSRSGEGTPLVWSAPPDNFIFINADLQTQRPGSASSGSVSQPRSQR